MNTARKINFDDTVLSVKEQLGEASANAILINDPFKAIAYADYWRAEAIKSKDPNRTAICQNAIASIEALMLKAINLSLSTYEVDAAAHVDSGFVPDKTVEDVILEVVSKKDDATEPIKEEVKPDSTTVKDVKSELLDINAELDKPLLSALSATCRHIAQTKGFKFATEFATKYLLVGNYTPKKDKQKAKPWNEKEIYSWLKEIKANIAEKKVETIKVETTPTVDTTENAAAKGLTSGEVNELELLNLFMPSSIVEGADYLAKRATLKKYTSVSENTEEELKMLSEVLSTKNKIKKGTFVDHKMNESELSQMYKKLEAFYGLFFKHRGYTEESVKAWRKATNDNEAVKHFEYLKLKNTKAVTTESKKDKIDPDLAKAKIIIVDKDNVVNVLAVRQQITTIYKNGGEKTDLKLHPDLMDLVNKEIKSDSKTPNLKFGTEALLLAYLETVYDSVAKQVGPLTKATDKEITEAIGKEVKETPSLKTFLELCTTAAKNDVSKEDFIKEHRSCIVGNNNKFQPLVDIGPKGSKTTITFADDKDFAKWVNEVYTVQEKIKQSAAETKIDKPPVDTKITTEELVDNFTDLKVKGKDLLAKGTPVKDFIAWLNKNMLGRKLKEQKEGGQFQDPKQVINFAKGTFGVDANAPANVSNTTEVDKVKAETEETKPTKDVSQIVEPSDKYSEADIAELIANDCQPGCTISFINLAKNMRDLYVSNDIKVEDAVTKETRPPTLPEIFDILEPIIKEVNPEMYKNRQELKAIKATKEKDQLKLPLEEPVKQTVDPVSDKDEPETQDVPHQIFEKVDISKTYPTIAALIKNFTTLAQVYDEAVRFNEGGDFSAALSMCLDKIPTLEGETNGWTPQQVELWFNTNVLNATKKVEEPKEPETVTTEEDSKEDVAKESQVVDDKTKDAKPERCPFTVLATANNKKYMRDAICQILAKEDTPELRAKIITTIQTSTGIHTKKFSKNSTNDLHNMVNNILKKSK